MSHGIHMFYDELNRFADINRHDHFTSFYKEIMLTNSISYDMLDEICIRDWIKRSLCNRYYVYIWVNQKYIEWFSCYDKWDFVHPVLIYGMNEEELTYDAAGRITKDTFTYNSMSNSVQSDITYATEADSPTADSRVSACSYKVNGTEKAKTQNRYNDNYKRLTAKLVTMGSYTYDKGLTYSKTRISKVMDVKNGSTFHNVSYGYDAMGRIVSESDSTDTSFNNTYVYDAFGRLIQENNKALDKTFVFKYDDNGNIIGCDTIAYTTENVSNDNVTETHVYDSTIKDRLVKFNNISISYDANGCPTYYNGRNYTWTKGKLTRVHCGAAQQPGSLYADCKFTYDAYGRRLSKSYTYDPNPASTSDYSYTYNTTYYYDNSGRLVEHGDFVPAAGEVDGEDAAELPASDDDEFHNQVRGSLVSGYRMGEGSLGLMKSSMVVNMPRRPNIMVTERKSLETVEKSDMSKYE